jgi:hypothetical protein
VTKTVKVLQEALRKAEAKRYPTAAQMINEEAKKEVTLSTNAAYNICGIVVSSPFIKVHLCFKLMLYT